MTVRLLCGDCRDQLASLDDNSIDACVTDPPYGLTQASRNGSPRTNNPETPFDRTKLGDRGFMGKQWDNGEVAHDPKFWSEVLRVLKPGGFVLAFGGTRTYHRLACAIEDAGFEVRDMVSWIYGSGFPKSRDVSKAIDKEAGAERTVKTGIKPGHDNFVGRDNHPLNGGWDRPWAHDADAVDRYHSTFAPVTDAAREWSGWGTSLKPALEPICMARKPLSEKTVAANVLRWGTGAINIDGCRVEHVTVDGGNLALNPHLRASINGGNGGNIFPTEVDRRVVTPHAAGRWPANVILDGSEEVLAAFPNAPGQLAAISHTAPSEKTSNVYGRMRREGEDSAESDNDGIVGFKMPGMRRLDSGSAARFYYHAKASKKERAGSKHPTVKPIALMRHLCRLVTPPGGVVLDPFAGTGTTGEAAHLEGFRSILIERETEYQDDIRKRLATVNIAPEAA
jgi:site-specific DNA-methyltransferase (adenine-specific)